MLNNFGLFLCVGSMLLAIEFGAFSKPAIAGEAGRFVSVVELEGRDGLPRRRVGGGSRLY